ncbi:MAG: zincin-like metallopeptidase domain-containing protein, partial [Phenylobacterium sp.]|nr:zincin-like metallopeptidase domain-containing protein [Phenylobacterium sp.]
FVQAPPQAAYQEPINWYRTALHELGHWTGHATRLDRDQKGSFGSAPYAREELVAEFGAAFLCADLGLALEPREDHAAYIGHWLQVLKNDKRFVVSAASHAQRAVAWLHGLQG